MTSWGGAWGAAWGDAWGAGGSVDALQAQGLTMGPVVLGRPALSLVGVGVLPRRVVALRAVGLTIAGPSLGRPALSVRPGDAQIAAMIAEQNRAAQWADDEEAIAALLLAA